MQTQIYDEGKKSPIKNPWNFNQNPRKTSSDEAECVHAQYETTAISFAFFQMQMHLSAVLFLTFFFMRGCLIAGIVE